MTDMTGENEAVKAIILSSLWSPASGPVEWTDAKKAATEAQAERMTQAAITTLDRHRIERAGDVERKFAEHIKWLTEPLEYAEDRDVADNMREAASLIASLRAENARARQEGWNAAIEAAAGEAVKGRNYWRDKCNATKVRRESRDYETMAIACVHVEHAIRARALSEQAAATVLPDTVGDSDGDDGA